jgi:cation transport ATPase
LEVEQVNFDTHQHINTNTTHRHTTHQHINTSTHQHQHINTSTQHTTHQHTTHQHINTSTHQHINTSTSTHNTPTHQHTNINTSTQCHQHTKHQHINTPTHQHTNTSTHQRINTSRGNIDYITLEKSQQRHKFSLQLLLAPLVKCLSHIGISVCVRVESKLCFSVFFTQVFGLYRESTWFGI